MNGARPRTATRTRRPSSGVEGLRGPNPRARLELAAGAELGARVAPIDEKPRRRLARTRLFDRGSTSSSNRFRRSSNPSPNGSAWPGAMGALGHSGRPHPLAPWPPSCCVSEYEWSHRSRPSMRADIGSVLRPASLRSEAVAAKATQLSAGRSGIGDEVVSPRPELLRGPAERPLTLRGEGAVLARTPVARAASIDAPCRPQSLDPSPETLPARPRLDTSVVASCDPSGSRTPMRFARRAGIGWPHRSSSPPRPRGIAVHRPPTAGLRPTRSASSRLSSTPPSL